MANVSQKIQTFLGGVSRKADFDKIQGQVVEANNCYPDETYGMIKRPGTELLGTLGIDFAEANDTYFFPIIREGRPRYLCGLSSGSIKVWSLDNPSTPITVNTPDGTSYLNYNNINNIIQSQAYRAASDDRRTVIVNRTVVASELANEWRDETVGFEWTPRGHRRSVNSIDELPQGEVLLVNWGDGGENTVQSNPLRPGIHYLPTSIAPYKEINNPDGTITEVIQPTKGAGCVLKCNIDANGAIVFKGAYRTNAQGEEYFAEYQGPNTGWTDQAGDRQIYDASVWAKGSNYPDQIQLSVDGVDGSRCTTATGLLPGYVHRVTQSGSDQDDVYFQPFSNTSTEDDTPGVEPRNRALVDGPYFWKECPSPDSYVGLDDTTLPHELIDNEDGTFTFKKVDYSYRWAGDNINNPAPSFTGSYINNVFFLNNRLGFLSEDNVILSRPINYGPPGTQSTEYVPDDNPWVRRNYTEIDFFRQSAIGLNDADPIDIKAANNDTSIFHTAIATPQGTILFADGQQSLLFQPEGLLSPLTASINSLSNYDMTGDVNAVIVGEKYFFVNKSEKYCRIYSMINQGMQNPPIIEDVTKEVADWLPNDMTDLVACPTDKMIFVFNRIRNDVYARREIGEGSSWVKWRHSHPVVSLVVDHDLIFFMTSSESDIQVSVARLYLLPDDYTLGENEIVYDTSEFTAIPENYNYYNNIIGDTVFKQGLTGVLEYYKPWHGYYGDLNLDSSLNDTFDQWLPWEDDTPVNALISISADERAADAANPWNVSFKITVRSAEGNTEYSPSTGSYVLPYDTKFRIRNVSGQPDNYVYDSTVVRCDTTPIHTGSTPPPYDKVRFVGYFTADGNESLSLGGYSSLPSGSFVTTQWITPTANWTGATTGYSGDPYLYLGGVATRVGGSIYYDEIVDHWFDPSSNNYLSMVDEFTPWVNYRSPHAPDNNNNVEFGSYSSDKKISTPWLSKVKITTNGPQGTIHGNIPFMLGNIGGYGFDQVDHYSFDGANSSLYFIVHHSGTTNVTETSQIDGYWEFEKDGQITRWAGYDSDGTLRTTLPIEAPCAGSVSYNCNTDAPVGCSRIDPANPDAINWEYVKDTTWTTTGQGSNVTTSAIEILDVYMGEQYFFGTGNIPWWIVKYLDANGNEQEGYGPRNTVINGIQESPRDTFTVGFVGGTCLATGLEYQTGVPHCGLPNRRYARFRGTATVTNHNSGTYTDSQGNVSYNSPFDGRDIDNQPYVSASEIVTASANILTDWYDLNSTIDGKPGYLFVGGSYAFNASGDRVPLSSFSFTSVDGTDGTNSWAPFLHYEDYAGNTVGNTESPRHGSAWRSRVTLTNYGFDHNNSGIQMNSVVTGDLGGNVTDLGSQTDDDLPHPGAIPPGRNSAFTVGVQAFTSATWPGGSSIDPGSPAQVTITGVWEFTDNTSLGVQDTWEGYDEDGTLNITDTEDECASYIWVQNTDGTETNTGIQATSVEVIPSGDDVIVQYTPATTTTFDPPSYQYGRFVGKATITGDEGPDINNRFQSAWIDPETGDIETDWIEFGNWMNIGGPFQARLTVGGGAYRSLAIGTQNNDGGPFTNGEYTNSWSPVVNWYDNEFHSPTNGQSFGDPVNDGEYGVKWRSSVFVSIGYSSGYSDRNVYFGGIYTDNAGDYPAQPRFTAQSYMTVVLDGNYDYYINSERFYYSQNRVGRITGHWEFTNDTSEGVQATWDGVDDAGVSSPNVQFTKTYPASTFKTAYLKIIPTACCECPTAPVPPITLNTLSLDPNMDLYTANVTVSGTTVTPPSSFPKLTSQKMTYVIANLPGSTSVASDRAGDTGTLTWNADHTLTADTDLTNYANSLIIGYRFDYHLVLPTFYFNQGNSDFDYTASLTVSRVKFALGLSGQADFEINVRNGPGWESSYSQVISNEYLASTAPLSKPAIVSVPVHKRNSDFQLQVKSDSPFPLSVDSCMWEGNYSPRYYRRL